MAIDYAAGPPVDRRADGIRRGHEVAHYGAGLKQRSMILGEDCVVRGSKRRRLIECIERFGLRVLRILLDPRIRVLVDRTYPLRLGGRRGPWHRIGKPITEIHAGI